MIKQEKMAALEAVLFTLGEPVAKQTLAKALTLEEKELSELIKALEDKYALLESGIRLIEIGDKYQLCTKKEYYDILIHIVSAPQKQELSPAVLETLAIIAYRQPVTKAEINRIRGVNSDKAVNRLIEFGLVAESGRQNTPGRPILFATTEEFLRRFGVYNLENLPVLEEELLKKLEEEAQNEANKWL